MIRTEMWKLIPRKWQKKAICIECYVELIADTDVEIKRGDLTLTIFNQHANHIL